jgi:hypothetical protein
MIVNVPKVETNGIYNRAECLFQIIQSAAYQLHQDALGVEQEDLALSSRLDAINMQVENIRVNDPLLK